MRAGLFFTRTRSAFAGRGLVLVFGLLVVATVLIPGAGCKGRKGAKDLDKPWEKDEPTAATPQVPGKVDGVKPPAPPRPEQAEAAQAVAEDLERSLAPRQALKGLALDAQGADTEVAYADDAVAIVTVLTASGLGSALHETRSRILVWDKGQGAWKQRQTIPGALQGRYDVTGNGLSEFWFEHHAEEKTESQGEHALYRFSPSEGLASGTAPADSAGPPLQLIFKARFENSSWQCEREGTEVHLEIDDAETPAVLNLTRNTFECDLETAQTRLVSRINKTLRWSRAAGRMVEDSALAAGSSGSPGSPAPKR